MFDARIGAYSSAILLVFLVQQQCGSTAEDFPSNGASISEDLFSGSQQTLSTEYTPRRDNFDENYDEIELMPSEKDVRKTNKDEKYIYGDITLNGHNNKKWERDPGTLTTTSGAGEGEQDEDNVDEYQTKKNGASGYNDWVTNRKRRVHSTFEKHKAHHRNYRRYGHRSNKKSFGTYKKYGHHRGKHKSNVHHTLDHQFNQKPYYQGQVSYYSSDDTEDDGADKPFHLPAKMRNHRRYEQRYHRGGRGGGHRAIEADEYPHYSLKWPHLSRIEYQITRDERREQAELEDNLPPYIRKYNRRNKQLLDLLEGTTPPSTTTPTPSMLQYEDDDYESLSSSRSNKKREKSEHPRYHNHKNPKWIMEDLFEEQRANPNNPNVADDQYLNDSVMPSKLPASSEVDINNKTNSNNNNKEGPEQSQDDENEDEDKHLKLIRQNELPSDGINVSLESRNQDKGTFRGVPASAALGLSPGRDDGTAHGIVGAETQTDELKVSPKANKFIYHRVASSRAVGTGTKVMGISGGPKKQRLPFVAITDRRLETSKIKQKDFEQNHLPLP